MISILRGRAWLRVWRKKATEGTSRGTGSLAGKTALRPIGVRDKM